MGKRVCALFLAFFLCFQVLSVGTFAATDSGSPKHIPRVVSVVFDDSGSMYEDTDRWAYTSYAMQAFAAMMGSEDVLYITYLNGPAGTVKVDLSNGAKHATVSDFAEIVFGGGTPDRVQKGADCLKQEYARYKTNAKYYLVVMADGELNSGLGKLTDRVATVTSSTEIALAGADFETVYFDMSGKEEKADGATCHFPKTGTQIVNALKDVSADIMGRTTVAHATSGYTLSFNLQYPALSIAVFAQKVNGNFEGFRTSVVKDGKALSCQVGNYNIQCPTQIIKNQNSTIWQEEIPDDPPAGVVSLITNNGNPLGKGKYTMDISGYDLQANDIVVLVEPAVRIGCKYILNDEDNEITFEELKKRVAEGDTVTVACGLYEMNSDGSAGEAIPLDVLSPEYRILINGNQIGTGVNGKKNTYQFQVDKSFANQQLNVEAQLKGYQPFVLKETFGELNIRIKPIPGPEDNNEIRLTKPMWKSWSAGQEGISFRLEKVDDSVLERVAISVEGVDGLPAGVCSSLGSAVRADGNTIVYLPTSQLAFAQLPDSFTVNLMDLETAKPLLSRSVKVVQPAYKFEIENPLVGASLSLDQLKSNTSAITFTLMADYDGSGQYIPVSTSDCESEIPVTLESGILPGTTAQEKGKLSFTPRYDPAVDTQLSAGDVVGKSHSLSAAAEVDGQKVQSDTVTLSFSSAAYRLEAENEITQPLTLDSIKVNQQKVIFKLLADYTGNGTFGDLADWDSAALEQLSIDAGGLPGKTETVYDGGGKPVGKAFIPQYDENNNSGIPFTAVAGKTHKITAAVTGTNMYADASVEVLSPDYELFVHRENIVLTDVEVIHNQDSVAFSVLRDGRPLTQQEMANLTDYVLRFDKDQPWIRIDTQVELGADGTAYLACVPQYGGWSFPAWWFWNWMSLFTIQKGDMQMTMTLGEDTASAALSVETSEIAWIIFFVSLGISLLILYIAFCCATRIRFLRGVFYKVTFKKSSNGIGYVVSTRTPQNANKKSLLRYLLSGKFMIPFCEQSAAVLVGAKKAVFLAQKSPVKTFSCRSYPFSVGDQNMRDFNKGRLSRAAIRAILNRDADYVLEDALMVGTPCSDTDKKLYFGDYLVEKGSTKIIFFLTKSEEKELKVRRNPRQRQQKHNQPRKKRGKKF